MLNCTLYALAMRISSIQIQQAIARIVLSSHAVVTVNYKPSTKNNKIVVKTYICIFFGRI